MNAQLRTLSPLSSALLPIAADGSRHPSRRHCIGDYTLDAEALDHFNELLARLHHVPLFSDQVATAARELVDQPSDGQRPIQQRMQLAGTLDHMFADTAWEPANDAIEPGHLVLDYVRSDRDLIPDAMPLVGRLDDAIVIDAAWPQLAGEVDSYLDYCRLRAIEAELAGCEPASMGFTRHDWQEARRNEARLIEHCRRVGASSYLPPSGPAFFSVR